MISEQTYLSKYSAKSFNNDELIALFMDFTFVETEHDRFWNTSDLPKATIYNWTYHSNDLDNFNSSWEWLMSVVHKIAEYRMAYPKETSYVCDCKIVVYKHVLYREVVNFVKWYLVNKK